MLPIWCQGTRSGGSDWLEAPLRTDAEAHAITTPAASATSATAGTRNLGPRPNPCIATFCFPLARPQRFAAYPGVHANRAPAVAAHPGRPIRSLCRDVQRPALRRLLCERRGQQDAPIGLTSTT